MVNMMATKVDLKIITEIVVRAASMLNLEEHGCTRLDLSMDLTACHANGCPLDLARLLIADKFDFLHDITGIMRHIDRRTGELTDFFCPRYAKPVQS